jgi:hypothetical protein
VRGLFFDINFPMDSNLVDPGIRASIGNSVVSTGIRYEKPRRRFVIRTWDSLLKEQIAILRNEIHAARVTSVLWFDGGSYGDIIEPIFISEGNGLQTEFAMPVDNVFAPSWLIYVNGVLNTAWSMREQSGILVFAVAPTGRITGKGKRKFRVILEDEGDSLLQVK